MSKSLSVDLRDRVVAAIETRRGQPGHAVAVP
jgi:hypothetical protein